VPVFSRQKSPLQWHVFCVSDIVDKTDRAAGERWEFRCSDAGTWTWRRRASDGDVVASSSNTFSSLNETMQDAARNGFSYASRARLH
jgi:hypothetical protein